ncbi:MAG TPA: squalene--hopene cyclase [Syntrophorhabdaceae bacterium]|jgi:squalene-hopene/tetraprenyl-beta-curcumene cyclase
MAIDTLRLEPNLFEQGMKHEYGRDLAERVQDAIRASHNFFVHNQHPDGFWCFQLESNVTITAEYLMLLAFAGVEVDEKQAKMARHILKHQRSDGTWAIYTGGKGDLSTTVEAYFALKLAGYGAEDYRLQQAGRFILANGGLSETRVFTKIFLALFGQYDWRAIPSVPVEIMLFLPWFPFSIYRFSSWARATFVPLSIVLDKRPVKVIPESRGVRELFSRDHAERSKKPRERLLSWKRFFMHLDKMIKATEDSQLRYFRKKGLEEALRWIREHQEEAGDWGGIQPAMVNSILALLIEGSPVSSQPVQKGFEALERFAIEREDELLLQSCISPVWDTALTALALSCSGLRETHVSMVSACDWLAGKQILKKGDWSVKRPHLEPGGWAFEFVNTWYPDIDDTAVVLMLLSRHSHQGFLQPQNFRKAVGWVLGMQGRDGGWGAFDVDNDMDLLNQIPFGDLEAMIDPSTPDITGRVLEMLGCIQYPINSKAVKEAFKFLKKTQEKDGLWWGRWGVNYVYGTWSVLVGLRSIGEDMTKPYVRKAVAALKRYQNPDGGWGESCESYTNPHMRIRGRSTPSQTAWGAMGLMAAGEGASREAIRAINFLLREQSSHGTWEEEEFTATGFPKYFMIKYHNYRNCFPLMALGKFLRQTVDIDKQDEREMAS